MEVTRRYRGEAALVVLLAGLATVFARPFLLVGAAGVAGWLLAQQIRFVRTVGRVVDDLVVTQSLEQEAVAVDDDVTVTVRAELPVPAPVALTVEATPPVGIESIADGDEPLGHADEDTRALLLVGERSTTTSFRVRCSVAGEHAFDPPTITATDETGRFQVTFAAGGDAHLTVTPRSPTNLHVGAGGETVDAPYGRYESGDQGVGIDLAEIRSYVPGDTVSQIDWNATARLGEPHVREFETTTERTTALVLDRRASMTTGPEGETKFDYARQVALGVLEHARQRGDPVAIYEVGEEGLLAHHSTTASAKGYARLKRHLHAVEPEDGGPPVSASEVSETGAQSPETARERWHVLREDDTAFADRLLPFFAATDPYVSRVVEDPLYGVVGTAIDELQGAVTATVVTDDVNPGETREVAKLGGRQIEHVIAFLTPTALFTRRDASAETIYQRYVDFERFRRNLASVEGVSAFEVGPGDRLASLLAEHGPGQQSRAGENR